MKKALFIIGVSLIVITILSMFPFVLNFSSLSNYGKGFIFGKIILIFVGLVLVLFNKKKVRNNWTTQAVVWYRSFVCDNE